MADTHPAPDRRATGRTETCGLLWRLLAMAYDTAAIVALWLFATALAMIAGFRELSVVRDPVYALYLLLVWFAYLAWCWHRGGMTLGMRAWRIRIEDEAGGLPGWTPCAVRFAASLLSAAAAGVGFAWSLFDREKRTWHDILSHTRLLRQRRG
ncbi:MAG: RDD family protein [Lysobacterales bacterium]|jgi:uncharacterized RDD family membrane protein YckC